MVVTEILNDSLKLKVGDIITHIDGELSEDYFEEVYSRISYGTDGFRNYKAKTQSYAGNKGSFIEVVTDNKSYQLER